MSSNGAMLAVVSALEFTRVFRNNPVPIFYCLKITISSCGMITVPLKCSNSIVGKDHAKLCERNAALQEIRKLFQDVQLGVLALLLPS